MVPTMVNNNNDISTTINNNNNNNSYISKKVKKTTFDKVKQSETIAKGCNCATSFCSRSCGCKRFGKECTQYCGCGGSVKCTHSKSRSTNDDVVNNNVNYNETNHNNNTRLLPQKHKQQAQQLGPYKNIHIPFENILIERTDSFEIYVTENNRNILYTNEDHQYCQQSSSLSLSLDIFIDTELTDEDTD